MHKLNMQCVLLVFLSLLASAACTKFHEPTGPLQTESQTVKLGGAKSVDVQLRMGAGEMKVDGSAPNLLDAEFSYNVDRAKPQVQYTVSGDRGTLTIEQPSGSGSGGHDARYSWDLHLSDKVPMNISVEQGAGRTELNLASLALNSLSVQVGAGESYVDLTGDYKHDVVARIHGGVGKATVKLPRDVGVRVMARGGIGAINAHDLIKQGDVYVNDQYGRSPVTVRVEVEGGIGEINLELGGPPPGV